MQYSVQNCLVSSNNTVPFFIPEQNTAVSNVDLLHPTESGWQVHRVRCYRRDHQHIRHDDGEVTSHTRRYGDVLLPSIIIIPTTHLFLFNISWLHHLAWCNGKGMILYSAVSSPLDNSKRFTLFLPWQTCSFRHEQGFSWKHSGDAAIPGNDYSLTFPPLSIARYSFIQLSQLRRHG